MDTSPSLGIRTTHNEKILLSSIIRLSTSNQRSLKRFVPRILPERRFAVSSPRPIPAQECNVVPPMLMDAIPVEAVIATLRPVDSKNCIISRSKTVFPVPEIRVDEMSCKTMGWFLCEYEPAEPVTKTLSPFFTFSKNLVWSSDRTIGGGLVASSPVVSTPIISTLQEVAAFNGPGSADISWVDCSAGGQRAE